MQQVQCSKNYFIFLFPKAGAFGNKKEKEVQKPRPKFKKYVNYIFTREYLLCLQSNASGSFLQTCINFVEQRLNFSHFEGSMIP